MDLFDQTLAVLPFAEGAVLLRGFALAQAATLVADMQAMLLQAPLRQMQTRQGFTMAAAMSNCGALGWVSDTQGYRYTHHDPLTEKPWPTMPASVLLLAQQAALASGFAHFAPDACLINQYAAGAGMGLHQDKNERDFTQPIVSVSLGMPATFLWGGFARGDKVQKLRLNHGDVLVWGGVSRLRFHGIMPLKNAPHPTLGAVRLNLTLRCAG
jgi:alkylated DNA repair protein (DNA oxidative demethylase)